MYKGVIYLKELYQFAKNDKDGKGLKGNSQTGKQYSKIAKTKVLDVCEVEGFYLWGRYDTKGLWENIYLGKVGLGKTTSLRARILEELRDERLIFWRQYFTDDEILKIGKRNYPKKWATYKSHYKRTLKKVNATMIIWVGLPDVYNDQILMVESDLIETMNPIANINRPQPKSDLQNTTIEVIKVFKEKIHENRCDKNANFIVKIK